MANLTIQDVCRRSGLSEPTLRYYEEIGLDHCPMWATGEPPSPG